jgi:hypothetical protein
MGRGLPNCMPYEAYRSCNYESERCEQSFDFILTYI